MGAHLAGMGVAIYHYMTYTITLIALPLAMLTACALDAPEAEPAVDSTDGVPCDLLKGPPVLPETAPTPPWRYPEEFDLIVGYAEGSPFLQLAPEDYATFRDSMRFNDSGHLTSYRYDVLQAALSPDDFSRAEEALGRRKDDDNIRDYYCSSRATCSRHSGSVCVTQNC